MWQSIPSLDEIVQGLDGVFTEPSMRTHLEILLGWLMCPGQRTEYKVFETIHADEPVSRDERHPFDRYYNFFSRSAWTSCELSRELAQAIVAAVAGEGPLYLNVDDSLLHKSGQDVYGLGWFYDAVASTESRAVTAPGNNWVVVGLTVPVPGEPDRFLCLPLLARLRLPGSEPPSPQDLAADMFREIADWFPDRKIVGVGDGGYSAHQVLENLPSQAEYVGLMRVDAELYDPEVPPQPKSKPGPKPKKGPRLPNPAQMAKQAHEPRRSAKKTGRGRGHQRGQKNRPRPAPWQKIQLTVAGQRRTLWVLTRRVLWPKVGGLHPVRIVLIHDPTGKRPDMCLFTTCLDADPLWVIRTYARRSSIEQMFRASKQHLQIQAPHHWCQQSIEKLAPWVWNLQSTIMLWYLTQGRTSPQAEARRQRMGAWDSEWSFRHMMQTLRDALLDETIRPRSTHPRDMQNYIDLLTHCLKLAV